MVDYSWLLEHMIVSVYIVEFEETVLEAGLGSVDVGVGALASLYSTDEQLCIFPYCRLHQASLSDRASDGGNPCIFLNLCTSLLSSIESKALDFDICKHLESLGFYMIF